MFYYIWALKILSVLTGSLAASVLWRWSCPQCHHPLQWKTRHSFLARNQDKTGISYKINQRVYCLFIIRLSLFSPFNAKSTICLLKHDTFAAWWKSNHLHPAPEQAHTSQCFCFGLPPCVEKVKPPQQELGMYSCWHTHTHPLLQRNVSYFWAPKVSQTSSLFLMLNSLDHCVF